MKNKYIPLFEEYFQINEVIRKEGSRYVVRSEKGKNLGSKCKTMKCAKDRLREVEFFKHKKGK